MSDDFLSRWSRRKRASDDDGAPEPAAPGSPAPDEVEEVEDEEQVLARLGLKHPDEMGPGDGG